MTYPATLVRRILEFIREVVRHLEALPPEDRSTAKDAASWFHSRMSRLALFLIALSRGLLPPPAKPRPGRARAAAPPPAIRLSTYRRGWLRTHLPLPAADVEEFQAYLHGPELQPFLQAEPNRLARLLNPLCHALGIPAPAPAARAPEAAVSKAATSGASRHPPAQPLPAATAAEAEAITVLPRLKAA